MSFSVRPPGYAWFQFLRNPAARVGIYTGVCLSVTFAAWVLVANRMPSLEPFALQRNILATCLLAALATMPVVRFRRAPFDMLGSSLLAWGLLTGTFSLLSLKFPRLEDEYYSAFHIFVMGAIVYLIFATLAWIGMIVRRVRTTTQTQHSPR